MVRETRHLWVGNLPENIREERIREHFKRYGRVQSVKLLSRGSGCGKEAPGGGGSCSEGTVACTVAFMDIKSAAKAHTADHKIDERTLTTEYYEPAAIPSAAAVAAVATSASSAAAVAAASPSGVAASSVSSSNNDRKSSDRQIGGTPAGGYSTSSSTIVASPVASSRFTNSHGSSSEEHAAFTERFYERGGGGSRVADPEYLRRAAYHDTSRGRTTTRDRSYRNGPYSAGTAAPATADRGHRSSTVLTAASVLSASVGGSSGGGPPWTYDSRYPDVVTADFLFSDPDRRTNPPDGSAKKQKKKKNNNKKGGSRSPSGSTSSRSRSRSGSSSSSSSGTSGDSSSPTGSSPAPSRCRVPSSANAPHGGGTTTPLAVHTEDRRPLAICVRNLPARSSDTSLKDGLYHEYKKHGKVTWVKVVGQSSDRYALVCFKKPDDVEKALEVSYDKLFFGCKIEVVPYQGYDVDDNEFRPYEAELDEYHPKATRTLFIGNLEKDVTGAELRKHFDRFGEIIEIDIKKQGSVSSYAFCQYTDIVSVVKAIRSMDGEHLGGNRVKLGFGKSMPTNCVWIDGVAESVSDKYLTVQFDQYGTVTHVNINREKCQALVFFEQILCAQAAAKEMRGATLRGKKLQIDFASRECQEAFFDNLEKQGNEAAREQQQQLAKSLESAPANSTGSRFARYDGSSRPRTASYSNRSIVVGSAVSTIPSPGTPGSVTPRGSRSRLGRLNDYYDTGSDYSDRRCRTYDEYSQGSGASHEDIYDHEYGYTRESPHGDGLDSRIMQSVVVPPEHQTTSTFAPPDIRHLQKERVHLLEQLEECPSSGDELMSPKKRLRLEGLDCLNSIEIESSHGDHRKIMEVRRLSETGLLKHHRRPSVESKHCLREPDVRNSYVPHAICKRRKTSGSDGERPKVHHHHDVSGSEGSRPGTPLCDERPENLLLPSEPRKIPRERPHEVPLCLPLPGFAAQVFGSPRINISVGGFKTSKENSLSSPPATAAISPRITNPVPPSPVQVPPPASPPPRPPSLSSNSSDSDVAPHSPNLEERIRSLDEKYEKWSGSRTLSAAGGDVLAKFDAATAERFRIRHKLLDLDLKEVQPSEIVKSVLAKRSVFDEDSKRLENVSDKYEPRDFNVFPRSGLSLQQSVASTGGSVPTPTPSLSPMLSSAAAVAAKLPVPTATVLSPRLPGTAIGPAKGLQYPFPSHPPTTVVTTIASTTTSGGTVLTATTTTCTVRAGNSTLGNAHSDTARLKLCANVPERTNSKMNVNNRSGCATVPSSPASSAAVPPPKVMDKCCGDRDNSSNIPTMNSDSAGVNVTVSSFVNSSLTQQTPAVTNAIEASGCNVRNHPPKNDINRSNRQSTTVERPVRRDSVNSLSPGGGKRQDRRERNARRDSDCSTKSENCDKADEKCEGGQNEWPRERQENETRCRLEADRPPERERPDKEQHDRSERESRREREERERREREDRERREKDERERREKEEQERRAKEEWERREKEERDREERERKEKEERERELQAERERREREERDRREKEERDEKERRDREERDRKEKEEKERREREADKEKAEKERKKEEERKHREDHDSRDRRKEEKLRHRVDYTDNIRKEREEVVEFKNNRHKENHVDGQKIVEKHRDFHERRNIKDDPRPKEDNKHHDSSRRDSHHDGIRREDKHCERKEEKRHDKESKENRAHSGKDRHSSVDSRLQSVETDKGGRHYVDSFSLVPTEASKRKDRNNSTPANLGCKRRMSSQDSVDSEDTKRMKVNSEHRKVIERRESKENRDKLKQVKHKNNIKVEEKRFDDDKRKERERDREHKSKQKQKDKPKPKNRDKERESPPRITKIDFALQLELREEEDKQKHPRKEKEKRKDSSEIEDKSEEKKKEKCVTVAAERRNHRDECVPAVRSDDRNKYPQKKEQQQQKMLNSSDTTDSDEPKKRSIFDIVDDEPAYISMYDKVKARSCKNMQKQEEEKRQEKLKAKFTQLKQSRAKREEKKRSTSWDEDSDSEPSGRSDRNKRSGSKANRRGNKMLITSSSEDENGSLKSKKKHYNTDSDSDRLKSIEPHSSDEMTSKSRSKSSRIASDSSEDELDRTKLENSEEEYSERKAKYKKSGERKGKDYGADEYKKEKKIHKIERADDAAASLDYDESVKLDGSEIRFGEHSGMEISSDNDLNYTSRKDGEKNRKKHKKRQKHKPDEYNKMEKINCCDINDEDKTKSDRKKHSKKDKKREKKDDDRCKLKKSKKMKSDFKMNFVNVKRDEKMEDIFGPLSDDSDASKRTASFDRYDDKQSQAYVSDSEFSAEAKLDKKHKEKKRKDKRTFEENENSVDFVDLGRVLEANLKDESESEKLTAGGDADKRSEKDFDDLMKSSYSHDGADIFKFSDGDESQETAARKEDKREIKEKKKKRKKSKEEKEKHHHHHHDKGEKEKVKSPEFLHKSDFIKRELTDAKEEKPTQSPSLPILDTSPVKSEYALPLLSLPKINCLASVPVVKLEKKREKFIPGFGHEIDEKIHETAIKSISEFETPIIEPIKSEEIKTEDMIKEEKCESAAPDDKPRAIISQEETEDAVAALLGESFGTSEFEDCYNEQQPSSPQGEPPSEENVQDDEEMRRAVQSLSTSEMEAKPDTPQSEHDLQIDTDTEGEEPSIVKYDASSKSLDMIDLSQPPKTPDIPSGFYKEEVKHIETPESKTVLNTGTDKEPHPGDADVTQKREPPPEPPAVDVVPQESRNISTVQEKLPDLVAVTTPAETERQDVFSNFVKISEPKVSVESTNTTKSYTDIDAVLKIPSPSALPGLSPIQKARSVQSAGKITQAGTSPVSSSSNQTVISSPLLTVANVAALNRLPIIPVIAPKSLQPCNIILPQAKAAVSSVSNAKPHEMKEVSKVVFANLASRPAAVESEAPNMKIVTAPTGPTVPSYLAYSTSHNVQQRFLPTYVTPVSSHLQPQPVPKPPVSRNIPSVVTTASNHEPQVFESSNLNSNRRLFPTQVIIPTVQNNTTYVSSTHSIMKQVPPLSVSSVVSNMTGLSKPPEVQPQPSSVSESSKAVAEQNLIPTASPPLTVKSNVPVIQESPGYAAHEKPQTTSVVQIAPSLQPIITNVVEPETKSVIITPAVQVIPSESEQKGTEEGPDKKVAEGVAPSESEIKQPAAPIVQKSVVQQSETVSSPKSCEGVSVIKTLDRRDESIPKESKNLITEAINKDVVEKSKDVLPKRELQGGQEQDLLLDSKEDNDYWSVTEQVESAIKKVDALCSADELTDKVADEKPVKDLQEQSGPQPEVKTEEPIKREDKTDNSELLSRPDETEPDNRASEIEILAENGSEEREVAAVRGGKRGRLRGGRGRGDRGGIKTRKKTVTVTCGKGRGGKVRVDTKKNEPQVPSSDVYEFRDDQEEVKEEAKDRDRPRLIVTIKSGGCTANAAQAVVKEKKQPLPNTREDPSPPNTRKSQRLKEKDGVKKAIGAEYTHAIVTRSASVRKGPKQSTPKTEARKSPRSKMKKEQLPSEEIVQEKVAIIPAVVKKEPKIEAAVTCGSAVDMAKSDARTEKTPEKLAVKEESHPQGFKASVLKRLRNEIQEEPMTLIDPVTGVLTPMRECEEGKYIPVSTSASVTTPNVQRVPVNEPTEMKMAQKTQEQLTKATVISSPQIPVSTIITVAPKPQSLKAHVLSQATKAIVSNQSTKTVVLQPQSQPTVVQHKPTVPLAQHLNVNVSSVGTVPTALSPKQAMQKVIHGVPAVKAMSQPPLSPSQMAVNPKQHLLQAVSKPGTPVIPKPHIFNAVGTNIMSCVATVATSTITHAKPHLLQPVQVKPQILIGKGAPLVRPLGMHAQQQPILTGAVASSPLKQSHHINQQPIITGASNARISIPGSAGPPPPTPIKNIMEPPKVDVSMGGCVMVAHPTVSPQAQARGQVMQAGMPVPAYEANMHGVGDRSMFSRSRQQSPPPAHQQTSPAPQGETMSHFPPGAVRLVPHDLPPPFMPHVMYQHYIRTQQEARIPCHIPRLSGGLEKTGDGQEGEEAPETSPPLELRRPGSVGSSLTPRPAVVPNSLHSPHDRTTDSPLVAQVYMHGARMPHYHSGGRYYEPQGEPPPAHRPVTSHTALTNAGTSLGAAGNLSGIMARHASVEAPATQRGLQVATPPHASQVPPQADSLLMLLQTYPVMWQGLLALKNDQAAVQMHYLFGSRAVAQDSLPRNLDGSTPPLRIAQRMRLEPTQVDGVARKMQLENEHCVLLALPCGIDHMDVLQQSTNLSNRFITYLQQKDAAGIVNIAAPNSQQAAYVVHIFPSCAFVKENLARIAPNLLHRVADIAHLLIVIATV